MENELSQEVIGEQPPILPETTAPAEEIPAEEEAASVDEEPEVTAEALEKDIEDLQAKKEKAKADAEKWAKEKRTQRNAFFAEKKKTDRTEAEETTAAAPKEEDFDTYEEYEAAKHDYDIDQAVERKAVKTQASQDAEKFGEFVDSLIFDGRDRYSDFNDVGQGMANPITAQTLKILQDFEHPADIVYYLGKNLQESVAVSRMNPTAAARKLAQIETIVAAELEKNPPENKPAKTVTTAPAPIKPSGSGGAPITKDPSKMTQSEYEEWRSKGGGK